MVRENFSLFFKNMLNLLREPLYKIPVEIAQFFY